MQPFFLVFVVLLPFSVQSQGGCGCHLCGAISYIIPGSKLIVCFLFCFFPSGFVCLLLLSVCVCVFYRLAKRLLQHAPQMWMSETLYELTNITIIYFSLDDFLILFMNYAQNAALRGILMPSFNWGL